MKIKFLLEYTDSPLWAMNEETEREYGYNIPLEELPLSKNTKIRTRSITKLYHKRLNPIYQLFPSLWSGRMCSFFQLFVIQVFNEICEDLGSEFLIVNAEEKFFNEVIDIQRIDMELMEFLIDPTIFAATHRIQYQSANSLKEEVQAAYTLWKKEELKWTTY